MADLFGYNRDGASLGQVASSEFAFVSIGGGKSALVQSFSVTYSQQIDDVKAVGDSNIYWVPGRPTGSINTSKLVGPGGFFSGWSTGQCGQLSSVGVNLSGGNCGFSGSGNLQFTGAVVEQFSLEMSSGNQTISESAQIRVATVSK